jgi:hypothetical protein
MTVIYTNTATKETYTLGGLNNLEHAWKMVGFAAKRNGWQEFGIMVNIKK